MKSRRFLSLLAAGLAAVAGTACSRRSEPSPQPAAAPAAGAARTTVLATFGDAQGASPTTAGGETGAHSGQAPAVPEFRFAAQGAGVAWVAEERGEVRVFHNGRAGKAYRTVGELALSPDGRRHAYGALVDGAWRVVVDGVEGRPFSAVQELVFSPDGAHLAYVAMAGERWYVVVDGKENAGTPGRYEKAEFSGDSSRIAFIDDRGGQGRGSLVVSDLAFTRPVVACREAWSLSVSADRTALAAVTEEKGGQRVVRLRFASPDRVARGPLQPGIAGLTISADGASVAYRVSRGSETFVVLDGREARQEFSEVYFLKVRPGGGAVGAMVPTEGGAKFHTYFEPGASDEPPVEEAEALVYSGDGRAHAYAARRGETWRIVVNGHEGPAFDRAVSPAFSPDGSRLVYRARKDGKRFVVVADLEGRVLRQGPPYEQVFPVAFAADGKSIAYGVKDGRDLAWKEEDL